MIHRFALALVLTLSGFALPASATPLLVSGGGTFSPGDTFNFSFQLDSTPTVSEVHDGYSFDSAYSHTSFTYTRNGVPELYPPVYVTFYSNGGGGLLKLCFSGCFSAAPYSTYIEIEGVQAYSGSESSPTILAGTYTPVSGVVADYDGPRALSSLAALTIAPVTAATPEPSSIALLGTGLLGMASVVRRRFVHA